MKMWLLASSSMEAHPLPWGVVIGASVVAAVVDLRSHRIPNLLTFPLLGAGLLWAGLTDGLEGLGDALLGCGVLALPYIVLFVIAGGGAGDAKMMGAIGAWLGLEAGVVALAAVCISGALFALGFALAKGRFRATLANIRLLLEGLLAYVFSRGKFRDIGVLAPNQQEMVAFPYGISILTGVVAAAAGVHFW